MPKRKQLHKKPSPSDRKLADDTFCIYCQREFRNLVKHIASQHQGTYAYNSYVEKGEAEDVG